MLTGMAYDHRKISGSNCVYKALGLRPVREMKGSDRECRIGGSNMHVKVSDAVAA